MTYANSKANIKPIFRYFKECAFPLLCYFTPVRYMPSALPVGTGRQRKCSVPLQSSVSRFRNEISSVRTPNKGAIAALRSITARLNSEISRTAAVSLSDADALGSRLQVPGLYPTGIEHRALFHNFSFFPSNFIFIVLFYL
jgi:hypothetical protein